MKPIFTLLIVALGTLHMFAQTTREAAILQGAAERSIAQFNRDNIADNQLFIAMPYASSRFTHFPGKHLFLGMTLARIELVYTQFPAHNDRKQFLLNAKRIRQLALQVPEILDFPTENWSLLEQTACITETQARALPHGFLLTFTEDLKRTNFTNLTKLEKFAKEDSTVLNVLKRNAQWKKMLVVTDLTASMSAYTAQLLLWFRLTQNIDKVEYVVFFNDGDDKPDSLKVIGKTGGIYGKHPTSFESIAQLANRVLENGTGGDEPENNIEALLYGLDICEDCTEAIMIVDNRVSPRDLELLEKVKKPIRIIICGAKEYLNIDYLNLARTTGGSVHTIEEDLYNLLEVSEGEEIKIGNEIFIIRKGKFELLKRI